MNKHTSFSVRQFLQGAGLALMASSVVETGLYRLVAGNVMLLVAIGLDYVEKGGSEK